KALAFRMPPRDVRVGNRRRDGHHTRAEGAGSVGRDRRKGAEGERAAPRARERRADRARPAGRRDLRGGRHLYALRRAPGGRGRGRQGYGGAITLVGTEGTTPVDRPNLSKDYLAGTAPEEWVPLRGEDFYAAQKIEILRDVEITGIDAARKTAQLSRGAPLSYG